MLLLLICSVEGNLFSIHIENLFLNHNNLPVFAWIVCGRTLVCNQFAILCNSH